MGSTPRRFSRAFVGEREQLLLPRLGPGESCCHTRKTKLCRPTRQGGVCKEVLGSPPKKPRLASPLLGKWVWAMNEASTDLRDCNRLEAGATEDPAPYCRAANLSLGLPLLALFLAQAIAITGNANSGTGGQLQVRAGAVFCLLLLLTGIVLAIKALRAKGVEMVARPFVRPIVGILLNTGLLALLISGFVRGSAHSLTEAAARRSIQAAAREAKSEIQRAAQENRPLTAQQAQASVQKITSALDAVSDNNSGPNAALARASKAYLLKIQPLAQAYSLAMQAIAQHPLLDMSDVTGREQLEARKILVQNFLLANDHLEAFTTNRLELYRQELLKALVPAESIDKALNAYEKVSPEKDELTRRLRTDDRYVGECLLAMLDLLELNLGRWKYDLEQRKVCFDDNATLDKYIVLREHMDSAAQEQKRLQARLMQLVAQ